MYDYVPSTVPGCRTPHFFTRDGRSAYDLMGPWFTLLRFDPHLEAAPLLDAAAARGVPLSLVDADRKDAPAYRHALLLSRPDGHVAWRGDQLPSDSGALVDLVRGAQVARSRSGPA